MDLTTDEITILRYLELQQRDKRTAIEDNAPSWVACQSLNKQGLIRWFYGWSITLAGERALEELHGGEKMICPKCGKEARDPLLYCDYCHEERVIVDFIDPAELLRLIEATMPYEIELYDYRLEVIVKYLSGDPKPLEKLAGEE